MWSIWEVHSQMEMEEIMELMNQLTCKCCHPLFQGYDHHNHHEHHNHQHKLYEFWDNSSSTNLIFLHNKSLINILYHVSVSASHEIERISVIHKYNHAFRGFSAMLTETEASTLSGI